jgi:hypothetical protein
VKPTQQTARIPSPRTGFFATLRAFLHAQGTTAPSSTTPAPLLGNSRKQTTTLNALTESRRRLVHPPALPHLLPLLQPAHPVMSRALLSRRLVSTTALPARALLVARLSSPCPPPSCSPRPPPSLRNRARTKRSASARLPNCRIAGRTRSSRPSDSSRLKVRITAPRRRPTMEPSPSTPRKDRLLGRRALASRTPYAMAYHRRAPAPMLSP